MAFAFALMALHCIALLNILTSNYLVFRLFLQTREDYFSLLPKWQMAAPCRNVNCNKTFSAKSNLNKHEKSKVYGLNDTLRSIPFDTSRQLYTCPTPNCSTSSKYKTHSPISSPISFANFVAHNLIF